MTLTFNLRASTNVTFHFTRDFSNLAGVYDIAAATIRMQARLSPFAPDPPIYEWSSVNANGGRVSFDSITGLGVFSAPEADMAQMPPHLVYDCRLELTNGAIVPLFSGRLAFTQGVTRTGSDSTSTGVSGLADTVTVDGEGANAPTPLPLSLSAVLIDAQGSATAARESAAAASLAATQATSSAAVSSSMISALIYG
jgi:hypothetical protein